MWQRRHVPSRLLIQSGDRELARDVRDSDADPTSFQMAVVDKVESGQPGRSGNADQRISLNNQSFYDQQSVTCLQLQYCAVSAGAG